MSKGKVLMGMYEGKMPKPRTQERAKNSASGYNYGAKQGKGFTGGSVGNVKVKPVMPRRGGK